MGFGTVGVGMQTGLVTTMTGAQAREFWKALMDNASRLVADAHLLMAAGSFGRARSLMVLAQEELGKALWVYHEFQVPWSAGDESSRTVDRLAIDGTRHVAKYLEAMVFGDELAVFWGDYSGYVGRDGETWEQTSVRLAAGHADLRDRAAQAARQANRDKQRGFYVDRSADGSVASPTQMSQGALAEDLKTAAQVIEMLLITDHSRMKLRAITPYDSTHEQQGRLLPIAHPEDWAAASEKFRRTATEPPRTEP